MEGNAVRREILCCGEMLVLETVRLDQGMLVLLTGGCRSHIGAVSTGEPEGRVQTQCFPGHRDQVISEPWARRLAAVLGQRVTVVCGIHYHKPTGAQLQEILHTAEALLEELLERIQ